MEQMNFFGCETTLRSRVITKQTQRESHEKVDKQVIRNNILNEFGHNPGPEAMMRRSIS